MLWQSLFNKLGKQPLKITKYQHVNAILRNPKTDEWETVFLDLKFDAKGNPYFVKMEPHRKDG